MRSIVAIVVYALMFSAPALSRDEYQDEAGIFDKPLKVERITIAPDPLNPDLPALLSCFHHDMLTVKQIDRGSKGADQLSLRPRNAGETPAPCTEENLPDETVITQWSGYVMGVRAGYAFFEADDGLHTGVGFAIFAPSGQKLFEELAHGLRGVDPAANGLTVRYRRVHLASCSLYSDTANCWETVKRETGLMGEAPDCTAALFSVMKHYNATEEQVDGASVVEYEAMTRIEAGRATTTPLPGAVTCDFQS